MTKSILADRDRLRKLWASHFTTIRWASIHVKVVGVANDFGAVRRIGTSLRSEKHEAAIREAIALGEAQKR